MPENVPAWAVISQVPDFRQGPSGAFVSGIVVHFRLASGTTASVFIPDAEYAREHVREVVAAKADELAAVDGLSG